MRLHLFSFYFAHLGTDSRNAVQWFYDNGCYLGAVELGVLSHIGHHDWLVGVILGRTGTLLDNIFLLLYENVMFSCIGTSYVWTSSEPTSQAEHWYHSFFHWFFLSEVFSQFNTSTNECGIYLIPCQIFTLILCRFCYFDQSNNLNILDSLPNLYSCVVDQSNNQMSRAAWETVWDMWYVYFVLPILPFYSLQFGWLDAVKGTMGNEENQRCRPQDPIETPNSIDISILGWQPHLHLWLERLLRLSMAQELGCDPV